MPRLVGLRDIADVLHVSRNQAWTWANRSATTGFPEPVGLNRVPDYPGDKTGTRRWDLDKVKQWYVDRYGETPWRMQ